MPLKKKTDSEKKPRNLKKSWYISCSPRSPEKLLPELKLLSQLEGKNWEKTTQLEFANFLRECDSFEGNISKSDPCFSARDRFKPFKTFGFAYVDENGRGKVVITDAGRALIYYNNPSEVFLKQLLKWQYPSFQHHGKEYENLNDTEKSFNTRPFVDILRVISKVGGLSKSEIAMFILPRIRTINKVEKKFVKEIEDFRKKRAKLKGKVTKKKFVKAKHYDIYQKLYQNENKKTINTKIRSSLDIADSVIRHFRYTNILCVIKGKLSFNVRRIEDINQILKMDLKTVKFFHNQEKFYKYIGNPDTPRLENETKASFINKLISIEKEINEYEELFKRKKKITFTEIDLKKHTIKELKEIFYKLETLLAEFKETHFEDQTRNIAPKEILDVFNKIIKKDEDIFDPPVFFEWNTYRALLMIDHALKVKPNFVMDINMEPINHAPGNCTDMIVEFNKYIIGVEVSLNTGKRQYNMEGEPVIDHIGNILKEKKGNDKRNVFGIFIAPKITDNTANYYFTTSKILNFNGQYGGNINIIPINLNKFRDIISLTQKIGRKLNQDEMSKLFDDLLNLLNRSDIQNGPNYLINIDEVIQRWVESITP